MLDLEKNWLSIVKTHKAYEFWSGIITILPKKMVGQNYLYHSKHMETPPGVYLSSWLTFLYIHDDGKVSFLSTSPKSFDMLTKDMAVREKTNIILDNGREVCSLIGRLAEVDENGVLTLIDENKVFHPIIDTLLNVKENQIMTPLNDIEDGFIKWEKQQNKLNSEIIDKVHQMKKNRKGKAQIALKLGITLQMVENVLNR